MEPREVTVDDLRWVEAADEWQAEGTTSRYGSELRWRAWRPDAGGPWEVEIPAGQLVDADDEVSVLLVYEGGVPLADDVRRRLAWVESRRARGTELR